MRSGFTTRVLGICTAAVLIVDGAAALAGETLVHGLAMPPGSQAVGENRYRVPLKYGDAIDFFGKHKGYRDRRIISQPGIRAINLENNGPGEWDSINIYEKDGEVRVYVIPRPVTPKKERHREKDGSRGQ